MTTPRITLVMLSADLRELTFTPGPNRTAVLADVLMGLGDELHALELKDEGRQLMDLGLRFMNTASDEMHLQMLECFT